MSKKVSLDINNIMMLNNELQQLQKEKELSFVVKYHLSKVLDKTVEVVKRFNDSKLDLFKKYGKEVKDNPGNFTLEGSKHFNKGMEELKGLIAVEEEFELELNIDDFKEIKSSVTYSQIFKFMKD